MTPPPEAMKGGRGVSSVLVIVIAIVTFLAGLGLGGVLLGPYFAPPARPTLLLGTNTPFPPFETRNSTTNVLEGFDIDLIQAIVTRAGYAYEWRDFRDFTALLAAVAAEGVDVAVGAITMNGAPGMLRNQSLDFTDPYFEADQSVLKRASDTRTFCAAADCTAAELDLATYRVGVQLITTSEFWVADNLPNVTVTALPSVSDVLLALGAGNVDFVVIDKPAGEGIAAAQPQFRVAGTIQTDELYGFAVPNNDPLNVIEKFNTALAAIRSDGTYAALIAKWF